MHNGFNQVYNMMPKAGSKAQQAKANYPVKSIPVVCHVCGKGDVTLYKGESDLYFCKDHRP